MAALEFAITAPVVMTVVLGVFDFTRGMIIWEETYSAAEAIAESAEKLSVKSTTTVTMLSSTQMQAVMSTIYAVMPSLNLGNGTGIYNGAYAVTLSSIVYLPLCSATSGCAAQTPYVLWSAYLTEGGYQLMTIATTSHSLLRACGPLVSVKAFPDDGTQLTKMVNPTLVSGGVSMTLTPQIVADVQYVFTPLFSLFLTPTTFWASGTVPTPLGDPTQEVTFDTTAPTGKVVSCTLPS